MLITYVYIMRAIFPEKKVNSTSIIIIFMNGKEINSIKNYFKNIRYIHSFAFVISLQLSLLRARVLSILFLPRNVNRKNPFTLHFARVFALTAIEIVHISLIIIEKFSRLLQTHYGKSLRPYKPKH